MKTEKRLFLHLRPEGAAGEDADTKKESKKKRYICQEAAETQRTETSHKLMSPLIIHTGKQLSKEAENEKTKHSGRMLNPLRA